MSALLLATLAEPCVKVMLLTTHVASPPEMAGRGGESEKFDASAVLKRQWRRVLATSQAQRSGPQNARAPMSLHAPGVKVIGIQGDDCFAAVAGQYWSEM